MISGTIIGTLWGARQVDALKGRKLVIVSETRGGEPTGRVVVAIDTIEAALGSHVLVTFGSGARNAVDAKGGLSTCADAAVTLIVDGEARCS